MTVLRFFHPYVQNRDDGPEDVPTNETWMAKVEALAPKEQETLLGTSLSRRFARLPLWLSHPANIGGFYGLLIALALLLPYAFGDQNNEVWGVQWIYHTSLLLIACGACGFLSLVMISLSKRHPMAPPRQVLYPMPFVGLALLSIDRVGMMDIPRCWCGRCCCYLGRCTFTCHGRHGGVCCA